MKAVRITNNQDVPFLVTNLHLNILFVERKYQFLYTISRKAMM